MAEYTIELRSIIENEIALFDFPYPFYDETKRKDFEQDFVRHFYFREIGQETIPRFKHYLEDKFKTVFPFYNELFKTATQEYSLINNYDMTEILKRQTDSKQKSSGISSTVGQFFADNESTATTNGTAQTQGTETENENGKTENVNGGTTDTTTTDNKTETIENTKKMLDTPMGKVQNIDDGYVTSIEKNQGTNQSTGNGTSNTETDNFNDTDTSRELNRDTTGNEETHSETKSNSKDEQKTTQDNNTRAELDGQQNEEYTLTRVGNIGVMTASDMIEKHIELQKKLKKIALMFFDECEDLFMLVY